MKKNYTLLTLLLVLAISVLSSLPACYNTASAANHINNTSITADTAKPAKTEAELIKTAIATGKTYLYHTEVKQIYKGTKGGLFIVIQSKSGTWYKRYL